MVILDAMLWEHLLPQRALRGIAVVAAGLLGAVLCTRRKENCEVAIAGRNPCLRAFAMVPFPAGAAQQGHCPLNEPTSFAQSATATYRFGINGTITGCVRRFVFEAKTRFSALWRFRFRVYGLIRTLG